MRHLGEQITDFVFGELSSTEMKDARQHMAECAECRKAVEEFQHTHAMLRTSPDVEPPRRIVFEVEKRPSVFSWRWLAPVGVAAALILAVLLAAPIHVQWQESQMTISFGKVPAQPALAVQPAPVAAVSVPASVQPVDYDRIFKEVQSSQQALMANELKRHDATQQTEIERLRGQLLYLANVQKILERQGNDNASSIQVLYQTASSKD